MIGSFFRYMFSIRKLNREPEQQELVHLFIDYAEGRKPKEALFEFLEPRQWSRDGLGPSHHSRTVIGQKCIGAMCTRKRVKWGNFLCLAGVKGLGLKAGVPSFGRWPSKKAAESEALA